jgi:hypothetical protein
MKFNDAKEQAVKRMSTPDFMERIREEDDLMLKHLPLLKQINEAGYITTESQGGHRSQGQGYEVIERAFITGFMLETHAAQFIKNMAVYTDKIAMFVPMCADRTHLPSSLDVPVTLSKTNTSRSVVVNTHLSTAMPESVFEMLRTQYHINKSEKIVFITCWDAKWKRNGSGAAGLFVDVLSQLKNHH